MSGIKLQLIVNKQFTIIYLRNEISVYTFGMRIANM